MSDKRKLLLYAAVLAGYAALLVGIVLVSIDRHRQATADAAKIEALAKLVSTNIAMDEKVNIAFEHQADYLDTVAGEVRCREYAAHTKDLAAKIRLSVKAGMEYADVIKRRLNAILQGKI